MSAKGTRKPRAPKCGSHEPDTGEVREPVKRERRSFGRAWRTPEEEAEAKRVREERAESRRQEVAALRALCPACETDDDPPVGWRKPSRPIAEPTGLLLDLPRLSGRGLPGSRLVLAPRYYDGCGPNGGQPHHSVTAHVVFRDGGGYLRRFVGTAIHRSEAPAFIAAMARWLEELNALDSAKGAP